MSTAVLTIDDIASANTPQIVDYLCKKNIKAVMFGVGENIEKFYEEAIYAVKKGMIVGNHSYSHISFSETPYEQCIEEIEKTESILEQLYQKAGVPRQYRPFRFPYGDKGGSPVRNTAHYEALQNYLKERGFSKLADNRVTFPWYYEDRLNEDRDALWTFDFEEYKLYAEEDFTEQTVYEKINNANPPYGGAFLEEGSHHIVLFHAHDETEAVLPAYYERFLEYCMERGVQFVEPEFVGGKCNV